MPSKRTATKQRFESKRLNRGGAIGYIAKYISKNINGYALDGAVDKDTGKPLKDTAAAVTAWGQHGAFLNSKLLACRQWAHIESCESYRAA